MRTRLSILLNLSLLLAVLCSTTSLTAQTKEYPIESMGINGDVKDGQGALQFIARLLPPRGDEDKQPIVYTLSMNSTIYVDAQHLTQTTQFRATVKSGKLDEIIINVTGDAEIKEVTGDQVASWSQRRLAGSEAAQLVIALTKPLTSGETAFSVQHEQRWEKLPVIASPISFNLTDPGLLQGQIRVVPNVSASLLNWETSGLIQVETGPVKVGEPRDFITEGKINSLRFTAGQPINAPSRMTDFKLTGQWRQDAMEFKLSGVIVIDDPNGADLLLLSGSAAFTAMPQVNEAEIIYRDGEYRFVCEKAGRFPIEGTFVAKVVKQPGKQSVDFGLIASALRPVKLIDMPVELDRVQLGQAPVEARGNAYLGYLTPTGEFALHWTDPAWQVDPAHEARLFFTAENLIDTTLSVGLLRQSQLIKINVLQGEMNSLTMWLEGDGEVTSVTGPAVLNWEIGQPDPEHEGQRSINIHFNREQTDEVQLAVELQTALSEFPVSVNPPLLTIDEAIRSGGFWNLRNAGAVELSPQTVQNLAQIAPEFLPVGLHRDAAKQQLAYRFAGNLYHLKILVDNILPEIAVSEILLYRLEENDQSITAELECDIRRAPVRDFHVSLPAGYSLAQVEAPSLADYYVSGEEAGSPELRLVFSEPLEGKRVIRLRLERNDMLPETGWAIPYLSPLGVKSVRGHVGVAAGPGLRLSVNKLEGLAEQVTTYFPQRVNDLRLALRLRQSDWSGRLLIEKLSQSVQAESLHLITLAEGALYGSTIINYAIGDAPVDSFRVHVPSEYQNINFSGPNVRSWKVLENDEYQIELQRGLTGTYTLLVTYEANFAPLGALLGFGSVEPLEVESEQGYIVVTSDFPFDISSVQQSLGLLPLEPNEVPAEFRLLYESQVLAAYQYTQRPFDLKLEVAPFQQGQTVNQVVDFTELNTQVSRDGEMLTTVLYQLKSKGHPHFRITLPADSQLWKVTVADMKVTPAADGKAILIPLPAGREADTPIPVRLQWASRAANPEELVLTAPSLNSPALLVNWKVTADPGQGLRYNGGDLQPSESTRPMDAWAWFREILFDNSWLLKIGVLACLFLLVIGLVCLTLLRKRGRRRPLFALGTFFIIMAAISGGILFIMNFYHDVTYPSQMEFTTPLEQSSAPMTIKLSSLPIADQADNAQGWIGIGLGLAALVVCAWRKRAGAALPIIEMGAWLLLLWGSLYAGTSPLYFAIVLFAATIRYLYVPRGSLTRLAATTTLAIMTITGLLSTSDADAKSIAPPIEFKVVEESNQQILLENSVANVSAMLIWDASAGEVIPLLSAPAVLQDIALPESVELRLDQAKNAELFASKAGSYTFTLSYRIPVVHQGNQRQIELPLTPALISRGSFLLTDKNIIVECNEAVSITSVSVNGQTKTELLFRPSRTITLRWSPETRDVSKEDRVFFAESYEVYQPMAGIVEGSHLIAVRPAQGIIDKLTITTPEGLTITTVDSANLSNWRFDPEKQVVELFFQPAHSTNFNVNIRSQYTSHSLPYKQSVRPLSLPEANSQVSLIALATDAEVHIGEITVRQNSTINLEDFPPAPLELLKHPGNAPVIRRAYRWGGVDSQLEFDALVVQPDTRVKSEDRISYGEDRTLINSQLNVEVNRAGLFQLNFEVPNNFDIESISSPVLSHWSESISDTGARLVTMQLSQKLLGRTQFEITLSGPGLATQNVVSLPRIILLEGNRQTGTVLVATELGYRLTPTLRSMVTQLDPKEYGIRDMQAQYFRYFNERSELQFKVDVIPPWIEATEHQTVTIRSGVIENKVRVEFSIENAGVREFVVQLPIDSLGVRFNGEAVDRFEPIELEPGHWRIYLDRKRIGKFIIEAEYQRPTPQQPKSETITGLKVLGIDQSVGTLSLTTQGRLELKTPRLPDSLQIAESQMIPPNLRIPDSAQGVAQVFRVLNADYKLPVDLIRRKTADTLPAQVKSAQLMSVISDSGATLTRMRINLDPGDKRLLRLQLPPKSEFWYAFVNRQSAWPWREGSDLILQLEASAVDSSTTQIEFFYSNQLLLAGNRLTENLIGPLVDLPMEAIEWEVYYPDSWRVEEWGGNMTQETIVSSSISPFSLITYSEVNRKEAEQKTEEAKSMFVAGNKLLESGRQEDARRAFEGAYNLSSNDLAFNEDARVQLQTLREQQAVVGLAQRRNAWAESNAQIPNAQQPKFDMLNYLQQDAQQLLQGNTMEDNAALREVAQEILQQQQAALVRPQALLTTIPEQGQSVRFLRSLQVDDHADLQISFSGYRQHADNFWPNLGAIAVLALFVCLLAGTNRLIRHYA